MAQKTHTGLTASAINQWRAVPRLLVAGYAYLMWDIAQWFMSLQDPTNAQAGFVSAMILAAAGIFNFYVNSGGQHANPT